MRKLKQVNVRWVVAGFCFLGLLALIAFFVYTKLEIGRAETRLATAQQQLQAKDQEYEQIISDPWYMKYEASKIIEFKEKTIPRKKTITYLIDIYDTVAGLDDDTSWIELTDFSVDIDHTIKMRWNINDIRSMYFPWWLIDRFVELDTIDFIHIPFYKKEDEYFEFVLEADIKQYDSTDG